MVFSSPIFIFFFLPAVLLGVFIIKSRYRNTYLLLSSLLFYAWADFSFVFVLIVSIIINYVSGIWIDRINRHRHRQLRKLVFLLGLSANLGLLLYYKYLTFAIQNINHLFHSQIAAKAIALPLGISFFTFQGMSYVIDLYRQKIPVQKNPISIALYLSLFPKLIAGPIVRYADIYGEIAERKIDIDKFAGGIERFVIGLSKKILIANVLAKTVDEIFSTPYTQIDAATAWVGAVGYMIQIYFDFSGYSDMAIGLGKMLGFDFMENFNLPYISKSITEFWRRWHISLASWFREYIYLPVSYAVSRKIPADKVGFIKTDWIIYITGISVTWTLLGFWHGASWTFLGWGIWHGLFIILEKRFFRKRSLLAKAPGAAKWAYTMFIVLIGWVLFRSNGIGDAWHYLQTMFAVVNHEFIRFSVGHYLNRQIVFTFLLAFAASSTLPTMVKAKASRLIFLKQIAAYAKPAGLFFLIILDIIFIANNSYHPFIYFQF